MEQMVRREIERQDALEADEAARERRGTRTHEGGGAHARASRGVREKELERREAAAVAGGTNTIQPACPELPDWPTAADTVDVDPVITDLGVDPDKSRTRWRRGRTRLTPQTRRGGGAGEETRAERGRPRERRGRRRRRIPHGSADGLDGDLDEDDGCYEVDPTRWAGGWTSPTGFVGFVA